MGVKSLNDAVAQLKNEGLQATRARAVYAILARHVSRPDMLGGVFALNDTNVGELRSYFKLPPTRARKATVSEASAR